MRRSATVRTRSRSRAASPASSAVTRSASMRIDYVELPSATAHELTRAFYTKAFGWTFANFGPDYSATEGSTVDVGLNGHQEDALSAPLPVIRVDDLEHALDQVCAANGI